MRRWLDRATSTEPAWPVAGPDELLRPPVAAGDPGQITQLIYARALPVRRYVPAVGDRR